MSDRRRSPDEREVDCETCKKGSEHVIPKFNRVRGRHCFKFSKPEVRADLIHIEWDGEKANGRTRKSLLKAIDLHGKWAKTERAPTSHEHAMKALGMCVWSWPVGEQEIEAYSMMVWCTSGQTVQAPHPDLGYADQPNLFHQYLSIYLKAKADYAEAFRGEGT